METNEENRIQEAEVSEIKNETEDNSGEVSPKKTKREFYIELVLFFILGILIGVAIKTEAAKRVTIGYDDYKMQIQKQDYDINKMQEDLAAAQIEAQNESAIEDTTNSESGIENSTQVDNN